MSNYVRLADARETYQNNCWPPHIGRSHKKPDKSPKVQWKKDITEQECADLAAADEKVETYWCEEGGGPPKGEVCPPPTPAPVKAYSYNFETMQPTNSPTPQSES